MPLRRSVRAAIVGFALGCAGALMSANASDPQPPRLAAGQSLESALDSLNAAGFRITFSTALVRPEMRLQARPSATAIEALLRELLAPWGLVAERMPDGAFRVIRARAHRADSPDAAEAGLPAHLAEVDVTASRFGMMEADSEAALFLDRAEVQALPHITDDAFRALRVLPGVAGGDFSARLHLRGGRRDEVALRVDGVEIHDPFHLRELDGPIGFFDTHLVERIDLVSGGQTADFGGRMSGVVDVTTRMPGADDRFRHALGISFVNAFARTGGRFADDRGFCAVTARRGYLDLVLERVSEEDEEFAPRYEDVLARAGFAPGERTEVALNMLLARDDMTYVTDQDDEQSAGESEAAHFWITLGHAFESGLESSTVLAAGRVDQARDAVHDEPGELFALLDMARELRFVSVRQDLSWQPSDRQLIRFGGSLSQYRADYDYDLVSMLLDPVVTGGVPIDRSRSVDQIVRTDEAAAWIAWRSRLARDVVTEVGLRGERFGGDLDATRAAPRANLVWDPGGSRQYRVAVSRVHQPQRADELQVEDGVTLLAAPERADQLSIGMTQRLGESAALRVDAYVKRYDDLRSRFENLLDSLELINEAEPDRVRVDAVEGRAHGVELSLQAAPGEQSHLWASYVYSRSEDREAAGWNPRLWDQAHALTAGFAWMSARWHFSLAANWHSGWPTTPVTVEETVGDDGEPVVRASFGRRNSRHLDDFLRVDLRASRTHRFDNGALTWYLEVFNLLNRRNPCCVESFDLVRMPGGELVARPEYDYWMPILPSFGIQYEF